MPASPFIDQLAADVRNRSANRPASVTKLADYIAGELRNNLDLPDEQIGAVLLCVAGAAMALAVDFNASSRAVANGIAVVGESLYHRPRQAPGQGVEL